LKGNT